MQRRDMTEQAIHDEILRQDFDAFLCRCLMMLNPKRPYQPNWHVRAFEYRLEQVRLGEITRLMNNSPPRSLKSILASVVFPAFVLGHDPTKRIIVVSQSLELAVKFANDFRLIVNSPWYKRAFPTMHVSRTKDTEYEVVTTQGGYRLAASIDGSLTGRGGDIIIVDDPLKRSDARSDVKREHVNEWYSNTLVTLPDDKVNGAIIIVMQRLHVDDLCGKLLRRSEDWTHLKLAAIAEKDESILIGDQEYHVRRAGEVLHPEREPKSALDDLKRDLDSENFAAQYQQQPIPPTGAMIKREWVKRHDRLPIRNASSYVLQSWDTAIKAGADHSFSACTTWLVHAGRYYLIEPLRGRFDFPTLKARAIAHAQKLGPYKILIKDAAVGQALADELKRAGLLAITVRPQGDKLTRMSTQSLKFENGLVSLPTEAPGLAEYEDELFAYPDAPHDDQVDSTSQALAYKGRPFPWDDKALAGLSKFVAGL